jgi:hypothetical protein
MSILSLAGELRKSRDDARDYCLRFWFSQFLANFSAGNFKNMLTLGTGERKENINCSLVSLFIQNLTLIDFWKVSLL